MVPVALHAGLHHVGGEFVGTGLQFGEVGGRREHLAAGREAGPEHIGHESQTALGADRTTDGGRHPHVARRPDQFRVGITHLVLAEPTAMELVDEVPTGEAVVDRALPARRAAAQGGDTEGTHGCAGYRCPIRPADAVNGHTGDMSIWYGDHVADESDLRLCGDLAGKRVLELGVGAGPVPASVIAAVAGAKAIVLDPDPAAIARVRAAAEAASTTDPVRVECHEGELADLGWATSASIDLVIAAHTASQADDLPRLLRQVHRVLRPGCPFVIAMHHPVHRMFAGGETRAYGAASPTFGELYLAFDRTNFRWDMVHELTDDRARQAISPTVLVLRARKQGV